MNRDDVVEVTSEVLEVLADSKFRLKSESGHLVLGYLSGRMIKNRIQVTVGDRVIVELSPYDLSRGRIIRRLNIERS